MNSELGMLLPFAAVMFVIWCGTRIVLRWIDRSRVSPVNAERRLHELSGILTIPKDKFATCCASNNLAIGRKRARHNEIVWVIR